ncbi:YncE family protein [Dermatobacter hominis]|uniref:YncE family protein n=1 Tax=Dermatobacter hominis TaxID=2884263 RepID=UPI001D11D409|nr:YncE family protein [Dermatobacter hominis]UDY35309.1 YncE family protein [Dermatobacter hominis]
MTRSGPRRHVRTALLALAATALLAGGCTSDGPERPDRARTTTSTTTTTSAPTTTAVVADQLPGMPPVLDAANVYSEAAAGKMSPTVATARPLVYVPDNDDGEVWVIDQATYEVVGRHPVGELVQHVVPSHDMRTLYANASGSSQLVPFDPVTGLPGAPIPVDAPYNLYFTPDGRSAIVMAERRNRMDWYDPVTWQRTRSVDVPCHGHGATTGGINHADWSADGRWFIATCEFSGRLVKVETDTGAILGTLDLGSPDDMPQDARVAPDGRTFLVADMMAGGVHVIDGPSFNRVGFIPTGDGAHGIYPSRDATVAYVSNRGRSGREGATGGGTVSVIDFATLQVVATWTIPGGGSPDMGGVSADGTKLWLSGRYDDVVYVFDTATGALVRTIPVGRGPHGLAVFPQPGRYSLGHTGNYR